MEDAFSYTVGGIGNSAKRKVAFSVRTSFDRH